MPDSPFLKSLFLICLTYLPTNVFSTVFNVSNTPQLRQAFLDATLNGQDDTILLAAGLYKTTNDGLGGFRYSDAEAFDLTIMGQTDLNRDDVILDGDGVDEVLRLLNSMNSKLKLKNLTIRSALGDGMHSNFSSIVIDDVSFTDNLTGLYSESDTLTIIGSDINSNSFLGIGAKVFQLIIQDSLIRNNHGSGGVNVHPTYSNFVGDIFVIIDRTSITGNRADSAWGGIGNGEGAGVQIHEDVRLNLMLITNSLFESNTAYNGAAIWHPKVYNFIAVNNTIVNNVTTASGGRPRGAVHVIGGLFINNIFNNGDDVSSSNIAGTFYNNYIDYFKLDPSVLLKDNILPSAGDLDFIDADYRIGSNSVVIDKGLNPNSTTFENLVTTETVNVSEAWTLEVLREVLLRDKDIRPRVIGLEIDMGAYEYGSPTSYPLIDLSGTVKTVDGTKICAMVLASGKYMFTCNPRVIGTFVLTDLPTENDGTVKRQIYADGFFPKVDNLMESTSEAVYMTRSGACPSYNASYNPGAFPDAAGKRIDISGSVLLQDTQTPICAMVLANGQYMFSCDGTGSYALNIPLDSNGQFKLQVFADGFAPTTQTFDEFKTTNDVRMARASECQ